MATNNYNKYDDDLKNLSSLSTKTEKSKLNSVKNMVFNSLHLVNGENNTPPLKLMVAKVLR